MDTAALRSPDAALPSTLVVRPLADPVVEAHGFGPMSEYVARCWLPVLGPTATWLYRTLGVLVLADEEVGVDVEELGRSLGVGTGRSRNSPLARSADRLVDFGAAQWDGGVLRVRRALAPLTEVRIRRLPRPARETHERMVHRGAA